MKITVVLEDRPAPSEPQPFAVYGDQPEPSFEEASTSVEGDRADRDRAVAPFVRRGR